MYDLSANLAKKISLTEVQQSGENIQGYFRVNSELQDSSPFKGMVTITKHIQFAIPENNPGIILSFDGNVQLDGTISGNYCTLEQGKQCSSTHGYGLWSIAPATP
jgi:hypothetical protein